MRSVLIVVALLLTACASQPPRSTSDTASPFNQADAAKTRISLGLTYLKNGNFQQAKYNLDKALQFSPDMADAHFSLGYYYQRVGELEAATKSYAKAMALAPDNADIANSFGAFLCQTGDYAGAKTYFLKAINNPAYIRVAESYENLALCAQKEGRKRESIDYLKQALNHDPGRTRSTILLLQTYIDEQLWSEADTLLQKYARSGTVNATTLWFRTQVEQGLGNNDKAQGYARMLVQMYPGHEHTQSALALIQQQTKQTSEPVQQEVVVLPSPVVISTDETATKTSSMTASTEPSASSDVHVVQKGENLYRISLQHNIKMQSLIDWNNLPASGNVNVGQTIRLTPPPTNESL